MEGMFLQSVPLAGSLLAGGLLLLMVIAGVAYGWLSRKEEHRAASHRKVLKKAA